MVLARKLREPGALPPPQQSDYAQDEWLQAGGKPLADRTELEARLQEAAALQPQPEIHIRSHARARYATVAGVLAGAQRHGLTKLGILGSEQFGD